MTRQGIKSLTRQQIEQVKARATRDLPYLHRLVSWMDRRGFVPGDPVYDAAISTRNAMQSLHMALHYATCEGGVGRSPGARDAL